MFWEWIPEEVLEGKEDLEDAAIQWLNEGLEHSGTVGHNGQTYLRNSVGNTMYRDIRQDSCIPCWSAEPDMQCYHIERSLFGNCQIYWMDRQFFVGAPDVSTRSKALGTLYDTTSGYSYSYLIPQEELELIENSR